MSKVTLTEGELRVLSLAWHCFDVMPKVNTTRLAELGGYKTPASANTAYYSARKKLLADVPASADGASAASAAPAPATPKTAGMKRGATATPDGTSKKRSRKSKAEMESVTTTEADVDDDETKHATKIKVETDRDVENGTVNKVSSGAQGFVKGDTNEKAEIPGDA